MTQNKGLLGWGQHEFNDAVVFVVALPDSPYDYHHDFYIDTHNDTEKLHTRFIHRDTDNTEFMHAFPETEATTILTLLLKHESYWLGFTDVNREFDQHVFDRDGLPTPENGMFTEQQLSDSDIENIAEIARKLFDL